MIIAPITISVDKDSYLFSDDLTIRKITDDEYKKYFCIKSITFESHRPKSYTPYNLEKCYSYWYDLPNLNYIGKEIIFATIPEYCVESNNEEKIQFFINSIRLNTTINIFCPLGFSENRVRYFGGAFSFQNLCHLKETDFLSIKIVYSRLLQKYHGDEKLKILLERFSTITNTDISDKIRFIEAVGIIESIVCMNENNELRFRVSLYTSFIIENISFDEVKYLYDIRSQLVHTGKSRNFNDNELKKVILVAKQILIKYLLEDISGKKILEKILSKK